MRDAAYPDDGDPAHFASWLIGRLSEIPGTTWQDHPPPAHTSYEDWHVWGTIELVVNAKNDNTGSTSKPDSPSASTRLSVSSVNDLGSTETIKVQKVIARISKHALRLERQYQLNREVLDVADPDAEKHLKALQLLRLPARNASETTLTVILIEDVELAKGVNDMRSIINYGPNWFFYNQAPQAGMGHDPTLTSDGKYPVGHVKIAEFLDIAIGACECLEMIHQGSKFVHGEIRGDSFFYDRANGTLKLQNYGSGVRSFENGLTNTGWTTLSKEFGIEHKLQFVAPEQTGRLQAQPDSRTDIYSLGILFYNMLTGGLPFTGSSPLEVMQNVLSRRVPMVTDKRVDVPDAISRIIQKMVHKNIDDRYHSASGVKFDLKEVQRLLADGDYAALSSFEVATNDVNPYFRLPTSLVGRDRERQLMAEILERVPLLANAKNASVSQHNLSSSLSSDSSANGSQRSYNPAIQEGHVSEGMSVTQPSSSTSAQTPDSRSGDALNDTSKNTPLDSDEVAVVDDTSSSMAVSGVRLTPPESQQYEGGAPMERTNSAHSADGSILPYRTTRRYRRDSKTEVIVLSGAPGLGKSSLIQDLQPTVRNRGYFCSGKFDQSKKTPFAPVLAAMSSLFRQIFSEPDLHSPFHSDLRAFIRPVWSVLHSTLGLPEWLLSDGAEPVPNRPERPGGLRRRSSPTVLPVTATRSSVSGLSKAKSTEATRISATPRGARFQQIYLDFLRFLSAQKLIVFCLDDITFADDESLDLLQGIQDARIPLVLLLTCRERTSLGAKSRALTEGNVANITVIELKPLSEPQVTEYVAATLHRSADYVFPLVAVVYEKTGGNPFFVREMLDTCYRRHCITYNWKDSRWTYNLDQVFSCFQSEGYGTQINNDFIIARLQDLPANTRKFLAWAAIVGNTFSFNLVKSLMAGSGFNNTRNDDKVQEHQSTSPHKADLIRQASQDAVRGLQTAISAYLITQGADDDQFSFCHDRYQQAATLLPECGNIKEMHFAVAQVMMLRPVDDLNLYDVSSQVCAAIDLVKTRCAIRAEHRKLLVRAANKAIATGGRASALTYLTNALTLLQRNPWDDDVTDADYQETLKLFLQTAEAYWLQGFVEPALALLKTTSRKARSPVDRTPSCLLHSRILARRGDSAGALATLTKGLLDLGVEIPQLTMQECDARFLQLKPILEDGSAIGSLTKPLSTDAALNACGALLSEAMAGVFWSNPVVFYRLALVEVDLHINRGNYKHAGVAYLHIGAVAITRFDFVRLGIELGDAGKNFFEFHQHNELAASRAAVLWSIFVGHFTQHLSNFVGFIEIAIEKSLSVGDRYFALVNLGYGVTLKLWASEDVSEVEHYCAWGAEEIRNWQDDVRGSVLIVAVRQYSRALQGKTQTNSAQTIMSDSSHDTQEYLQYVAERSSDPERTRSSYMSFALIAQFLYGHINEAVATGEQIMQVRELYWSSRLVAVNAFYLSLARMAIIREQPDHPQAEFWLSETRRCQARMVKWSEVNDVNFSVYSGVLRAALEEHDHHIPQCLKTYEEAIDNAEVHNFVFEQALASELYAEFMIRRGANRPARKVLGEAIATYRRISCYGKASQLAAKHEFLLTGTTTLNSSDMGTQTMEWSESRPSLLLRNEEAAHDSAELRLSEAISPKTVLLPTTDKTQQSLGSLGLDMIDVASILRSTQALASELDVDRLLAKLTKIILESTGADLTGIVVENDDNTWRVAAISDTGANDYPSNEPLEHVEDILCNTVVLGSLRFQETILTDNVLQDDRISNIHESYRNRHPGGRAVCAMPIFHGQKTILGCLYIEGPPHTFTERCINVLRLLSNSVSISIHNAMLFKRIEKVSASNALMVESQKTALAKAREAEKKAKLAEAEAMRNVRLKEEAAKAKSLFLANVSHELRTPLNGVIGMSELLKGSTLSTEQQGYTESIRVCADTLLTVINDILDYSKLDAGKMVLHSIPMSVMETISEVVRALSYSNMQRGVKTITQLDIDKDLLVMGDPVRFHQILMNLLSNAYKFTAQGSITIKAVIDHENDKEITITSSVADTGLGITEEQQKKLFLPFSQADSSTARSYGGTGLGLSICKAIVEGVMKGRIWMESAIGKGTTVSFTLTFPKLSKGAAVASDGTKTQPDPMALFSPTNNPGAEPSSLFSPPAFDLEGLPKDQIRICIAEDNAINQKIAISYVKKLGYSCEAHDDGRQTVDALVAASAAGKPFHLVLMDCQMPVLDGYDATREIRKHPDPLVRSTIIVAMTASAVRGDREACLAAGMNNYLAKPVKQAVLRQLLEGYLDHRASVAGGGSAENGTSIISVAEGAKNVAPAPAGAK